jgi:hypothetical protein
MFIYLSSYDYFPIFQVIKIAFRLSYREKNFIF